MCPQRVLEFMLKVPLFFLESPLEEFAYFLQKFVDLFEDPMGFLKGCIEKFNDPPEDSACFPMHCTCFCLRIVLRIHWCLQNFIYFLNGSPMISYKPKRRPKVKSRVPLRIPCTSLRNECDIIPRVKEPRRLEQ